MKIRKIILSSILTLAFVCAGDSFIRAEMEKPDGPIEAACDAYKSGDAEGYLEAMTRAKKDVDEALKTYGKNSPEHMKARHHYEHCSKINPGAVLGQSLMKNSLVEEVEDPSDQYPSVKLQKKKSAE